MSQEQLPSEQQLKAFMQKLGQFRETLGTDEQRMLDAMAIAAFSKPQEQGQGDVQGYQWVASYGPWGNVNWVWAPNYAAVPYTPFAYAYGPAIPVNPYRLWYP